MPRPPASVRIVGDFPLAVRQEAAPGFRPGPWAIVASVSALSFTLAAFLFWVLLLVRPGILPETLTAVPPGQPDLKVILSSPSLTFVGDETAIDVSVVNTGATPLTGTLTLSFSASPTVHVTSDEGNTVAFASLAHGARATNHVKFVAEESGELTVAPRLQLEGENGPADLTPHAIAVSSLPRANSLRSWIAAGFAALIAAIARPWLKYSLKNWIPSD